jgi:hypothetical protein
MAAPPGDDTAGGSGSQAACPGRTGGGPNEGTEYAAARHDRHGRHAGLKELKDFKNLHTLDLSSTAVTDAGLRELKDCKELQTLYLRETKVTEGGVKELKAALPRCEIIR